jgi:hypothetical protein
MSACHPRRKIWARSQRQLGAVTRTLLQHTPWPPANGSQATALHNQLALELAPPSIYRLQRVLAECNKSLIVMVF